MSELVWVSPQYYLHSDESWKSSVKKNGYIPILRADLGRFEESLKSTFKEKQGGYTELNKNLGSSSKVEDVQKIDNNEVSESPRYVPIEKFVMEDSSPLLTFAISSIVYIESTKKIETLLLDWVDYLKSQIGAADENGILEIQSWSRIFATGFETQDIFIRMSINNNEFKHYCSFLNLFKKLSNKSDSFSINFDSNTKNLIRKYTPLKDDGNEDDEERLEYLENKLSEMLVNGTNNVEGNPGGAKPESLEEYHIDLTTLSDLPSESLNQLCKDIMEFRSRVVTIEREKMLKDKVEENQRRRQKMIQMFDEIRKHQNSMNIPHGLSVVGNNEHTDSRRFENHEDLPIDEDDDGYQQEQKRIRKYIEDSNLRYKRLLNKLNSTVEDKIKTLEYNLENAKSYGISLRTKRALATKDLLYLSTDNYYNPNRSFRDQEIRLDDLNREQYGSHITLEPEMTYPAGNHPQYIENKINPDIQNTQKKTQLPESVEELNKDGINIRLNFSVNNSISDERMNNVEKRMGGSNKPEREQSLSEISPTKKKLSSIPKATNTLPAKLTFTDEALERRIKAIKESGLVAELVKEYLGVYEEELVEYIFDNIKEYKDRTILLTELKETFDEDAVVIVDKIWNSREFLGHK